MAARYRSFIPKTAIERVLTWHPNGAKQRAEYLVGDEVVGERHFFETGEPCSEKPLRRGKTHGTEYDWYEPGVLTFAEPHVDGLPHGTARQWINGKLVGTYKMVRGTGIDLWWQLRSDGTRHLSEARYLRDGHREGFEWWIEEDERRVYEESHFRKGLLHGIERQWNRKERLRRGYPKYWVNGKQVSKRAYLAACKRDPTLPPFREEDNAPERQFPPEIVKVLGPRA
ncbi:hypothetical protein [Polyangium sp. y55x31]|uniref:toxin-antitoxin system YwqK family antitoxin n=1 Tax=Polyangium sp. y55x31 TaxID=3042688 RepID=UPI0024827D6C|nr:hypothetical protein [Polyangium sp. y55x31]MDI1475132.1 hypothetical protein [Polyangium sp. y55x31]